MTKDKIITLIDVMPAQELERLLVHIVSNYHLTPNQELWDSIPEVEPDEIDKSMLLEMENDQDCHIYT